MAYFCSSNWSYSGDHQHFFSVTCAFFFSRSFSVEVNVKLKYIVRNILRYVLTYVLTYILFIYLFIIYYLIISYAQVEAITDWQHIRDRREKKKVM